MSSIWKNGQQKTTESNQQSSGTSKELAKSIQMEQYKIYKKKINKIKLGS